MKNMLEDFDPNELQRIMQIMRCYSPAERGTKLNELAAAGEIEQPLLDALREYFPDTPSIELGLGSSFGKYTITDLLGEGGMGRVYQAWDPDLMRNVAIKLIRPDLLGLENEYRKKGLRSPEQLFQEESSALASLQHAGIVSIFERGFARGPGDVEIPYCAMELVNGDPLRRYCLERHLGVDDCLELMRQVCGAVGYAHSRKIVHRDLKPDNILIDHVGQPRVLDFGLAVVLDKSSPVDLLSLGMGSPGYLAPEQISHEFGKIGYATDVYALGVTLYELLGKKRPYYVDPSKTEFRNTVTRTVPPKLGALDRNLGGEIETIVATCLEKHPADRYSSANVLQSVLTSCIEKRRLSRLARELGFKKDGPPPLPITNPQAPARNSAGAFPDGEATIFDDRRSIAPARSPSQEPKAMAAPKAFLSPAASPELAIPHAPDSLIIDPGKATRIKVWLTAGGVCLIGAGLIIAGLSGNRGSGEPKITTEGIRSFQSALFSGADLYDSDHFQEAAEAFTLALEQEPENEIALIGRALSHQKLGEASTAASDVKKLVDKAPGSPLVQRLLNQLLTGEDARTPELSMTEIVDGSWKRTSAPPSPPKETPRESPGESPGESPKEKIESLSVEEDYQKGVSQVQSGQLQQAIETLKAVTSKSAHYKEADMNMAVAYFNLGQFDNALRKYDEIIAAYPEANNAYNFRGQCHLEAGEYEKAVTDFTEFLRLTPEFSTGYNFRGQAYLKLKDYEKAEVDFTTMIALEPGSSISHEFRGRARIGLKKYAEAILDLNRAAAIAPTDADIFYFLSKAQSGIGNTAESARNLTLARQLNPGVVERNEKVSE